MVRKFGAAAGSPGGVAPLLGRRPDDQHEGTAPRTARFSLKVRRRFQQNQNHALNNHNSSKTATTTTTRRMIPFVESRGGSDHEEEDADINYNSNDYDDDDPCSTLTPTYADSFAGRRRGHAQVVATSGMDIWTACRDGDVPYVSATVQRFPEFIHLEQRGRTPLYHACENNHVAIAAMLLEAGATDWDGSCAQVTASRVVKNLLLQYKVVDQQLQMTESKEDITKNLLPSDTGLTAWEVCSLPGSGGHDDAFSFCGADDAQSHYSKPIERVLCPAAGTGDLREEPTPDEAEPEAEAATEAVTKEISEKDFVLVQESRNNDHNNNSNEEPQGIMASDIEETALNFGKVRQHFETVINEKKKTKRRWLPKKLLSKKKDSVDVVETESQSQESRQVVASASANKNEPVSMEPSFLEKLFPSDQEDKDEDLVEEKPVVEVATPSAASVAATTVGTSTVTSAAVHSAAADFAWSDQEIVRIGAVHKNSRWLALRHKISPMRNSNNNNNKNNSKATHLEVEQGQVEVDPPRWATEFVTNDRSGTPVDEGAEIVQPASKDEVKSVASNQANSSGTSSACADSNRPVDSVDLLTDLGNITAGWFTFSKAKSHADAAAAEEDAASISKHSISNLTDGGVELRDKRTSTTRAKSPPSMTLLEDEMASAYASASSTNDFLADLSATSELGSSKDLTVSSRVSKKSLASKAASIASKASKLTAMSREARKSGRDSTAVATSAPEENDTTRSGDEVASLKTWPGVEVAPKGDGSTKTWSAAAVPSLMPEVHDDNVDHPRNINKSKKSVKTAIIRVFSSVKGSANRSMAAKEEAAVLPEKSVPQSDDRSVHSVVSVRSNGSKRSWTSKQLFTDPFGDESDDESSSSSYCSDKAEDVASAAPSEANSSARMVDVVAAAGAALSKETVSAIKDEGLDEEASAETQDTQSESEGDDGETEEGEVEVTLEDFGMYSLGQNLEDHCNHYDEEIRTARGDSAPYISAAILEEHANGDIKKESDLKVVNNPISSMKPILRNKQPVGDDDDDDDEAFGPNPQQPRVDSQLSRFAQSFSTTADYRSDSEQEILDTPSVEETLESEGSSKTSQEQEGNEGEAISSGGEELSGNEDTDDDEESDDEESDDDLGSVGSKTHASDATGFQLMGTASAILVHPSDTFRAISEEISCILGNH